MISLIPAEYKETATTTTIKVVLTTTRVARTPQLSGLSKLSSTDILTW